MPGEGLHIPVDADDSQIRKLAAALRSAKKEAVEAAKAIRGVGAAAGSTGGGNGAHAPGPPGGGRHSGILHGIARLTRGTEFGHLAHAAAGAQSFGGAGMGMMALGGAVAGAVVAFKLLSAASERAMEAAKRELEVRMELTHAIRDSIKSADSKAVSAFGSNKEALLSLAGVGGEGAVQSALKFGQEAGPGGVKAYASIAGMHQGFQESNLEGAKIAAGTGQISIEKAADMIASGKVRSGMNSTEQAAAVLSEATGHRFTTADISELTANLKGSKLGAAAERFEAGEGGIVAAGVNRFETSGSITTGQRGEAADIKDPGMAARVEVTKKLEETNRQLQVLADSQFRIVKWIEHGAAAYGIGSGSAQDAADREQAAQAAGTTTF